MVFYCSSFLLSAIDKKHAYYKTRDWQYTVPMA